MLINTADPLWPRVSAAFNSVQGPTPTGLTVDQFAQNCILNFVMSVVKNYEGGIALAPAPAVIQAAQGKVVTDFGSQVIAPVVVA
jgi:hypothetical protein